MHYKIYEKNTKYKYKKLTYTRIRKNRGKKITDPNNHRTTSKNG